MSDYPKFSIWNDPDDDNRRVTVYLDDERALHFNFTHEGVIVDAWDQYNESRGTLSLEYDDVAEMMPDLDAGWREEVWHE